MRIDWRRPPGLDDAVAWRMFWEMMLLAEGTLTRAAPATDVSLREPDLVGSINLSFLPDMTLWCEFRAPHLSPTRTTLQVWPAPAEIGETPGGCAS
ncbi:MAG: hypothetical protein QM608_17315 [Caulobacter sp.]